MDHRGIEERGMKRDRLPGDSSVAILGAGAAGLSAARALHRAGYRRVSVLEQGDRVGGKCWTIQLDGRTYELGAVLLTHAYRHVRALAREVGVRPTARIGSACLDLDTGKKTALARVALDGPLPEVSVGVVRLAAELLRHRRLLRPGFAAVDPELAMPFARWAQKHGLAATSSMIEPWFTAFGYGYLSEIPAAYVLKYLALFGPSSELSAGYQDLWERVARPLDVRRNVTVRRVRRDGEGVVVESDSGSVRFDAIVLACPADAALRVLDAGEEERDLLSRVRWQDYRVVAASVRRFCDTRQLFFPKHFGTSARGDPMCAYRRWPESDVRLFYAFGDGTSLDDTAERVVAMVRAAGGEVTKVHCTVGWRYFPHVTPEDMASGFYGRLEALQGSRRTFYAGELLSFGTVENVVAYSDALVERYFDARRKPAAESRASGP
jgi:predicted NAD/FAD-binding protein